VAETVDPTKVRFPPADALKLLAGMTRLVTCRGKAVEEFDLRKRPADDVLLAKMIGPTGNLKAPTFRTGKTLVIGFNADAWRKVLGV
jgi:arsenate reductase-like glutaredoxin family protein